MTGTNNGYNEGGVYTSPYYGTITPAGGTATPTWMICDDYYDNSYLGESWTAYQTNLADLPQSSPSPVLYDGTTWGGVTLNQSQEYMAVAYLAEELMAAANAEAGLSGAALTAQEQLAGDYGFAIWDLTNVYGYNGEDGSVNTNITCQENETGCGTMSGNVLDGLSAQEISNIVGSNGYIADAIVNTAGDTVSDFSNVTIYNWVQGTPTSGCGGTCAPPPQEFITVSADPVKMAEPGVPLLFLFYACCAGGVLLALRRRRATRLG